MRQLIFIDDSGDPGLKKSNTKHLIIAAVVLTGHKNLEQLSSAINGFRTKLNWNELDEFKFSSTRKSLIKDLLITIRQLEFESYILIIDKTKLIAPPRLFSGETLYNYAIKELLCRLDLFEPIITIDGVYDKQQARKIRTYLRQALKKHGIEQCKINFVDSRKESIIQLADIIAGSIARSFDTTKNDRNDYLKLIKMKIKKIYLNHPHFPHHINLHRGES